MEMKCEPLKICAEESVRVQTESGMRCKTEKDKESWKVFHKSYFVDK